MTDTRFRVTIGNENDVRFVDSVDNRHFLTISFKDYKDAVDCRDALLYQCNMMNELHEENQDLKSFNQDLSENLSVCADKRLAQGEYLTKLTNENEQLKERINELQKESYGNLDGLNYYQEQNGHLSSKISDLECENEQLKKQLESEHTMLDNAILLERTRMGKNCLKQFRDAIQ